MHIFAYHPELLTDVWVVFRFWDGLSSMGGVLGALLGIFIFFWKNKIPLMPYLDPLALGTASGWGIGPLGCYLVHDHPGANRLPARGRTSRRPAPRPGPLRLVRAAGSPGCFSGAAQEAHRPAS